MVQKLILDVDTGTDDAVAIMLAALHPALDLVAVTTVNGNIEVEKCTDNTLRTLEWIGRSDIPVFEGLAAPIVRPDFPTPRATKRDPKVHMAALPMPAPKGRKQDKPASVFLSEIFKAHPGQITLVAVGPLSNLAATLAIDPAFASNVAELIIMGGAINKSNITPSAEFNIWADPEAAAQVFRAGFKKITLVPLDATHEALVSRDQCDHLRSLDTAAGVAAADIIMHRISGYEANQPTGTPLTAPVHDAVCVAALVAESIIETKFVNVVIETVGEYTIGRTVVDHEKRTTRPANCHVAFHANRPAFINMLTEIFARGPKPGPR
ncbi:nucleoside hydrolase [Mesorhizobium sp. M7A.F.Ca.US.006.01.1.1]|uniref:nucleoside hydrolase n=1 Tax=Mesorhizobium sp. M7A.F.Ca.US.006.01.1.1 TaxID=2496707 RepID=UPI000FCA300E|nr:nucleoside hydrolase [Mesorhizobium sp. M7A.F.Ca.US.006.01.1.1]RUZ77869.1 nucleoside hydrolase [Mesorhizobium sp. M7A.F.Ca.US.006.01.1.1]